MTEGQIIKVMPKFTIWDIESVVSRQTFLKARELVQRIAGIVKEDKNLYPFAEKFSQEETGFGFEMELKDIIEK